MDVDIDVDMDVDVDVDRYLTKMFLFADHFRFIYILNMTSLVIKKLIKCF